MAEMNKPLEDDEEQGEMFELEDDELEVEDTEDGGAIIRMENERDAAVKQEHFANIVEEVDAAALSTAVQDLLEKIDKDRSKSVV